MIKIEKVKKENSMEIDINISGEEWEKFLKNSKKELFNNLELKGFRKGKVPEKIAQKNISDLKIQNKAVDMAIEKHYPNLIKKVKNEKVISRPSFRVEKISNEEVLIKMILALFPEIDLGDIKDIKVSYKEPNVTEKEINEEFKQSEKHFMDLNEIKDKDYEIKNGDIVNLNFVGKLKGKEFENGKADNHELEIGSKSFIDGFEDQLIGMKKDQEKVIKVTFPEEYPDSKLKGKEVTFDVKINSISKNVMLKGEELEKRFKQFDLKSFDDLKLRIKKILEQTKKQEADDKLLREFIEIVKKNLNTEINIPDVLLNDEVEKELKSFKEKLLQQGQDWKEYLKMIGSTEEDFKEKNLKISTRNRIMDGLIYSKVIDDFRIKVTDNDYEKEVEEIAKNQKMNVEDLKKQFQKEMLFNSIQFKKLINKIKKNSKEKTKSNN